MALRTIAPREKYATVELVPGGTLVTALVATGFSDSLEIGAYPIGSLQVVVTGQTGLAYKVQESNVDHPNAYVDHADFAAAKAVTWLAPLTKGAKFVRVLFSAGSAGTIQAVYNGSLQS